MRRRVATVLLVAAALCLTAVGCGPTGQASPTPTVVVDTRPSTPPPSSPSASPTPSPTPTVETDADAKRHAYERMLAYFRMLDKLRQDPTLDVHDLGTLAKGSVYTTTVKSILDDRKSGWHQVGAAKVGRTQVADPTTRDGKKTISIAVCVDYSHATYVDEKGKQIGRGKMTAYDMRMQRYPDGWYVVWHVDATRSC